MAFCNNCGAQLPDDSKFCTSCGAKNGEAPQVAPQPAPQAAPKQESAYSVPNQAPVQKEKKPVNKKLFIILGAAVAALILIIVVVVVIVNIVKTNQAIKDKTLTFKEDYFEVNFDGYDTLGTVDVYYSDEFEDKAFDALGYTSKSQRKKTKAQEALSDLKYEVIDFEISKEEELSNGDEITIKVTIAEDYDSKLDVVKVNAKKKDKKDADIIIKEIELKYTVEGLDKITKYNPFDDLEVETSGSDGDVWVGWTYVGDEYLSYYDFECDNEYDLSIGDEFTITIEDYAVEYLLDNYGVLVTETSKTFEVESADRYITSAKDVSDDLLTYMQELAVEEIEDEYDWADCTISDLKYMGMYFLNLTDEDSWDDENTVILVYSGTVTPEDTDYDAFTAYMGVEISDLYEYADGTQDSSSYAYMLYNSEYIHEDSWDTFYGWFTEKEVYDEAVELYSEEYSMELYGDVTDYSNYVEPEEEGYETIEEYFESEEGSEFIDSQEEYLLGLYDESYSDIVFSAVDNVVTYEYTYIEEVEVGALDDLFSKEDFESDFEEWGTRTGVTEMSIQLVYYNPDGTVVYDETFSNF